MTVTDNKYTTENINTKLVRLFDSICHALPAGTLNKQRRDRKEALSISDFSLQPDKRKTQKWLPRKLSFVLKTRSTPTQQCSHDQTPVAIHVWTKNGVAEDDRNKWNLLTTENRHKEEPKNPQKTKILHDLLSEVYKVQATVRKIQPIRTYASEANY